MLISKGNQTINLDRVKYFILRNSSGKDKAYIRFYVEGGSTDLEFESDELAKSAKRYILSYFSSKYQVVYLDDLLAEETKAVVDKEKKSETSVPDGTKVEITYEPLSS